MIQPSIIIYIKQRSETLKVEYIHLKSITWFKDDHISTLISFDFFVFDIVHSYKEPLLPMIFYYNQG